MATLFVPEEIVPLIHADLLRRYGGRPGIRDRNLLDSALAQPRMTFAGRSLHRTLFEKAAAYGYHVCQNHPFVDGNKRVAFVLMDLFLQNNGWTLTASEEDAYTVMINLADGRLSKQSLAKWLKTRSTKTSG
ncbi:MAG: type II toxin-antitoxin system death-on-curing family toxin [Acidobacteriia bacterium]|nr:type II toxin-antitoxin system death-on-curing family toxin [Terriglobia bacterium]